MDGHSEAQPPGEASIDEAAKLAQPGALARVRCPVCKHTTYDPQQVETGWCLWCKAYTFVGRDGVDRRGGVPELQAPRLVYAGAVWRHRTCGALNEGELYLYRSDHPRGTRTWYLTPEPVIGLGQQDVSVARCAECDERVYWPDELSGYWAMVVAPIERVGQGERIVRGVLPLPFTDTVPPGETSPQP